MNARHTPDHTISALIDAAARSDRDLLQILYKLQRRFSHIPPQAIPQLAQQLHIPVARVKGVITFYSFLHDSPRGDYDILFSDNITDRLLGNHQLMQRLCNRLNVTAGVPRNDGKVSVDLTSCTGMCDQGPALLVNGMAVTRLDRNRVDTMADLVETGVPLEAWPAEFFLVEDNIRRRDILLSSECERGVALETLLDRGHDAILDEVDRSGLRGRGGAGFPTAMKWRLCMNAAADEHYVVCNADEGEPGTFKDRVLLNTWADELFEGMTLCAGIIGAAKGFLYLRGEYHYMREQLERNLEQRREAGLLGHNILGQHGFDFDIDMHMGAGAYICGEESALIESLEGRRGTPRNRPPFPVTHGYRNRPTVVNNVETFVAAARIAAFGADWFTAVGTGESTGTKLLSISGDCARPGIYEYPFGTRISDILLDCGAVDTQAVQAAGAAGTTLDASEFDRSIAFEDVPTGGSFMILNRQRDVLDLVRNFTRFFRHESCGFCTPCRVGSALMSDLVDKVIDGHASRYDLKEMQNIATVMKQASHCGLGSTAPNIVTDTLQKFPDSYLNRLSSRGYEPAFDIDAAVEESRRITGRTDPDAYIHEEP